MGQGWINKYYWYFGDGTMDSSNTFIFNKKYTNAGNYAVTLVAVGAEGCRDTMSMYVQVRDLPCTGNMKFVNLQDGSNWNIDPRLSGIGVLNSVQGIEKMLDYSIYPNPNEGKFSIHFKEHIKHPVEIAVYDMLGKEVYHNTFNDLGSMAIDLNFESLSNGTYYLHVNSEYFQFNDKKFIVIHQ
jgi:PKD repeat protein